ncbi:MAG: hypothetical protein ACFCUU_03350 [Cyclobacteriaceae bacterium]
MAENTEIDRIFFRYDAVHMPAPFCYKYELETDFRSHACAINYAHEYYGREELSLDEILDEGFTENDDFQWKGSIPVVWKQEILERIEKSNWRKSSKKPDPDQAKLEMEIYYADGHRAIKKPDDVVSWEIVLQEIVQAIFEVSLKEKPLKIQYINTHTPDPSVISLEMKFAYREAILTELNPQKKTYPKKLTWDQALSIIRVLYGLDFDADKATVIAIPTKPGEYIDPGEGAWYKLGDAATNPTPKTDLISKFKTEMGLSK